MLEAEGIGKNLEQAIENALFELKAPREDVDIKILSEGGLFKKARVIVSISEDAKDKYVKRVEKRKEEVSVVEENKEEEVEKSVEIKEEVEKQVEETLEEKEVSKIEVSMDAKEFLEEFLQTAGKENCTIEIEEDDKYITYKIQGDDLGDLIGHRGESFYALNRIVVAVAGKTDKKILLDIGGYREKRVETLTSLANRTAQRVIKTGRYVKLDPMNPSDRRIIHTALQDEARVSTMSKGEEPRRYVIVFPTDTEI